MKLRRLSKAILVDPQGKVLILRRSDTAPYRPHGMDIPGGNVDEGEHFEEAAIREVKEETGIKLAEKDMSVQFAYANAHDGVNIVRLQFLAKLTERPNVVLSFEHDEFYWMSPQEAIKKLDHPVWGKGLSYMLEHSLV